jgi:hypothetical protein
VRDDALRLALARRQRDLDEPLGAPDDRRGTPALVALGAARPLLAARRTALTHRSTVAGWLRPEPEPRRLLDAQEAA